MPLDPTLKMMLDQMAAMNMPPIEMFTPEQVRQGFGGPLLQAEPTEVAAVENRTIPGPLGDIPVRIYTPEGDAPYGALVFYHGGGWTIGDLDSYDALCRLITHLAGVKLISVDYRLAPENKFPAAVHDAYAALEWVAANAGELHIDPARIAVGGDSAGGNLSAVVAQIAKDKGTPQIASQVLIYPATDFTTETESYRENAEGYILTRGAMEWFNGHYLNSPEDMFNPLASPALTQDLSALPPALVITAEFDPLRDHGAIYADRLKEAGVPVEYTNYDGMVHGFVSMFGMIGGGRQAVQQIADYLKQTVGI